MTESASAELFAPRTYERVALLIRACAAYVLEPTAEAKSRISVGIREYQTAWIRERSRNPAGTDDAHVQRVIGRLVELADGAADGSLLEAGEVDDELRAVLDRLARDSDADPRDPPAA